MNDPMTVIKERPIQFSGAMVQAILDNRKTQTRRVIKLNMSGRAELHGRQWHIEDPNAILACPYGQIGDRLWVREPWRIGAWNENSGEVCVDYKADNYARKEWLKIPDTYPEDTFEKYWIQCSDDAEKAGITYDSEGNYHWEPGESPCRWRPAMFMPRWASRITLEITGIRVERLQDITKNNAINQVKAEGVDFMPPYGVGVFGYNAFSTFMMYWDSLNTKRGYSWESNPWVWVIEFKRLAS